jgi:hypothetical protein
MRRAFVLVTSVLALAGVAADGSSARADERVPYTLDVRNASAKVGEQTMVVAIVKPPSGFNITKSYRSRVIDLSALDDKGVEFAEEVVLGRLENGSAVFEVPVTPTEVGEHPINGVIRISFYTHGRSESKSVPLMAIVTGE